jgi:transposase
MIDWPCPECGTACKLYDHQPERQWRHLDTCQYQTILHAERVQQPRSASGEDGVGGAFEPFTALFELLAIEWLKAASQKAMAGLLKLSWDEIHGIIERAVKRGLERRKANWLARLASMRRRFGKAIAI